jgi:ABC-type lipoprotein export system ATPase subunit
MKITVQSDINETPRVLQIRGMFDLPEQKTSRVEWDVHMPLNEKPWYIGLIVGPSGCGKSTIARKVFPHSGDQGQGQPWQDNQSVLDGFPPEMGVKDLVEILSSVGFSSPPAWLRPFHVLSTGQQFRVTLAQLIAANAERPNPGHPIVFDEYTSVVDRTVAQIASAALSKVLRRRKLQFVAVTCHEDVEPWLNPNWVYRPAEQKFAWRSLQRRPNIKLKIVRCHSSAWALFAPHHYLSAALNQSAVCFLATWIGQPVAFSAWLPFVGKGVPTRREHRTVTLPDYQGVGIGNALSACIASMWKGLSYKATSTTTHPAMMRARCKSKLWTMTREPSMAAGQDSLKHATARLTAGFQYIGPPMHPITAKALLAS